ncbi:MAG: hypothetical protein VR68_16035 [Peptococcaceae bacterium BRH_c4a]|nr:MAG: hypothetical protein VR68_16035 [Peptococcaceae bacterium BRH_c4a]
MQKYNIKLLEYRYSFWAGTEKTVLVWYNICILLYADRVNCFVINQRVSGVMRRSFCDFQA